MSRQAVPAQPMEVNDGVDIHMQLMEDLTQEQVYVPEVDCDTIESSQQGWLLAGLLPCGERGLW